jgi:branched-chain amino acid transport system substrate-binding protein
MTLNTHCEGVEYNELSAPFIENYKKRYGEVPTYTADTYVAIKIHLKKAIEKTGSLDADKIVAYLEQAKHKVPTGVAAYIKDAEGRPLHDLRWGPGYLTSLGIQWRDGVQKGVWPNNWVAAKGAPPITYKGIVPYKIAPWVIEAYKK